MKINHIPRRTFLQTTAALAAVNTFAVPRHEADGNGIELNQFQRRSLQEYLARMEDRYDPAENMVTRTLRGSFYHTQLSSGTVHPTRDSLKYAVALLDSGDKEHLQRAKAILSRVIGLQDQNPQNRTYGIWSWYMEEPLEQMAPPDWNWADFCGTQLLLAWMDHRHRIGQELADKVRDSIVHAANSIKKRNVGPGYTNIAIMGTNVTLLVGELFDIAEFSQYGKKRLRRFHEYTFEQGSFTEYNSPTYTIVALTELIRMLMYVNDPADRELAQELHDFAWKHAARHFHAPTHQWGGPHSRCYRTILTAGSGALHFIEYGLGAKGILVPKEQISLGDDYRLQYACPQNLHHYFKTLPKPRLVEETFVKRSQNTDSSVVHGVKTRGEIIGTTYQHPQYSFGSINVGDLWNQRRPFLAYWGTPDKPSSLRVRFLHDFYDYSSAQIFTEQHKHGALAHIAFATNSGDTHISIDRIDGTIQAKDLRLRLEFEGDVESLTLQKTNNEPFTIEGTDRHIQFKIQRIADSFGGQPFEWQITKEEGKTSIDAIAYAGEEKTIDFTKMKEAFLAFAFQIQVKGKHFLPMDSIKHKIQAGKIHSTWANIKSAGGKAISLSLENKIQPDKKGEIQASYKARKS